MGDISFQVYSLANILINYIVCTYQLFSFVHYIPYVYAHLYLSQTLYLNIWNVLHIIRKAIRIIPESHILTQFY